MLRLYYTSRSVYSRPVWIALLEKKLQFELVSLKLDGDQFQPEFLTINPFNHVPVLEDNGFRVIESLAILDYLEAKYPTPALLPTDAKALAIVRMVEMVAMNELLPVMVDLIRQHKHPQKLQQAKQQVATVLAFFEDLLGSCPYFGGEHLTLAEVVAGTMVPWLPNLGVPLTGYQKLSSWSERLLAREAWATTQLNLEAFEEFKRRVRVLPRVRWRQHRQLAIAPSQNSND